MPADADVKTMKGLLVSRVLGWTALCVALLAFGLVIIVQSYVARLAKTVSDDLERRTVAWEKGGFSRPVLRGEPRRGNAAVAHFRAMAKIGVTEGILTAWPQAAIVTGISPPVEVLELARARAAGLSDLRAATQHSQAWKPWVLRTGEVVGEIKTPAGLPFCVLTTGWPVSAARRSQRAACPLSSPTGTMSSAAFRARMPCDDETA